MKKLAIVAAFIGCGVSANASVILSTDFTGRTVSGTTASNITWVTNGVSDPGDLTVVNNPATTGNGNLFSSADSAGHFAVNNNVANGGAWYTDISTNVIGSSIALETVDFAITNFNGSGAFQTATRDSDFTLEVIGSSSGSLGSVTGTGSSTVSNPKDTFTLTFVTPILLTNAETYDFRVSVVKTPGSQNGNNTSLDSLVFNGSAVPEPSSTALLGLGGLALLLRRSK